jgi:N-acetyl-anhydromuramyl-L-alanine amidase AmpD
VRSFFALFCVAAMPCRAEEPAAVTEPEIVSRAAWGALSAKPELMQEQKPAEIILHHTGTRQQPNVGLDVKLRGLQGFSMTAGHVGLLQKPAWGDVLYHYYIDVSGKIGEGRDVNFAGDSATSFDNDDRIQIVLEGDFENEQPSATQIEALTRLVTWLAFKYGIAAENISGHGDHEATACPGRNLKPHIDELKAAVLALPVAEER